MAVLRLLSLFLCIFLVQGLDPRLKFLEDIDPSQRIIQGSPAALGQFPHQVHLMLRTSSGSQAACGGSLISARHVLTAAHCVQGMVSVNVRVGSVTLSTGNVYTTTNLRAHPNYNSNNLNNDLAIITLNEDIPLSANVKPIRLQKRSELGDSQADKTVTVSGFGATVNGGSISQNLMYVDLRVITNAQCQQSYGSIIIASTICAVGISSPAQSSCNGDSGGPMVIKEADGEFTHVGIVSFGSSAGCSSGYPSGYVRSVHFLDWINQNTGIPIRP